MDIIAIIEKYIEFSVRRDELKNTIENEKRGYYYATVEGDMAYHEGNYESEKGYNNSARSHIESQQRAERDLLQVEQLIEFTHQAYSKAIENLNEIQLKEASVTLSVKKSDIERKIDELSQRRIWANSKGDVAFSNHNFEEEQEYNRISSNCYIEIRKLVPTFNYYKAFIDNLNYHADKKIERDFGSKKIVK